jgi:hypothetical protein
MSQQFYISTTYSIIVIHFYECARRRISSSWLFMRSQNLFREASFRVNIPDAPSWHIYTFEYRRGLQKA